MAIAITAYIHLSLADLNTMLTEVKAEMSRQRVAGSKFNLPGGRQREGVQYDILSQELAAIQYAISYLGGNIVTETIGDLSADEI